MFFVCILFRMYFRYNLALQVINTDLELLFLHVLFAFYVPSVVSSLCTCNEKPQYTRILSTAVGVLRGNMLGKPFREGNTARLVFAPTQGSRPGRPYGSHNYTLLLSVSMKNIFCWVQEEILNICFYTQHVKIFLVGIEINICCFAFEKRLVLSSGILQ